MVKSDLVDAVAEAFPEWSKRQAKKVVDLLFDTMQDALVNGDYVLVTGFGKIYTKKLKPRVQRIPGSGKEVQVPERNVVRFKAGKGLKEAVR